MPAWRVLVGVPLGIYAALILAFVGLLVTEGPFYYFGRSAEELQTLRQAYFVVVAILSLPLYVYLIHTSPSARETFRRSLLIGGLGSTAFDFVLIVQIASLNGDVPQVESTPNLFGTVMTPLVLLMPFVWPVLYFCVVPSRNRPGRAKETQPGELRQ